MAAPARIHWNVSQLPRHPKRATPCVELLRDIPQAAFARCPAEAMVLLRLVYLHGLTQREIVRTSWSESKVSRLLSDAMVQIESNTLREKVKKTETLFT